MCKTILMLGASRYYQRSIQAVKAMGHRSLVIDRDPNADGFAFADDYAAIDFSDIGASVAFAQSKKIDAVVPLNDYGVPTAAAIAEDLGLVGLTIEQAEIVTDKSRMRSVWNRNGISVVQNFSTISLSEALEVAETMNNWPLILKPADSRGGGSRGVVIVGSAEEMQEHYSHSQSFSNGKPIVIEEFLEGTEHSLEVIVFQGECYFIAISDKIKTEYPYRVDKSVLYPGALSEIQQKCVFQIVREAIKAIGLQNTTVHAEVCYTETGPKLFEVGARCGGGGTPDPIMPYLTGVNLVQEQIRVALGEPPKHRSPQYMRGSTYHFLTPRPGVVKTVRGVEAVLQMEGILDAEVFLQPGDTILETKVGGDRSGFIISGCDDRQSAYDLACKAESMIEIEYES